LLAGPAFAADTASVPSSAPPVAQKLEAGSTSGSASAPAATTANDIKPDRPAGEIKAPPDKNATKLTERRVAGKVTEVEVKKGKNTYYVKPNDPDARGIRGAQWKVGEFGGPKTTTDAAAPDSAKDSKPAAATLKASQSGKTPARAAASNKASVPLNGSGPDSLALPAASTPLETK
jgi:hypothetical protein